MTRQQVQDVIAKLELQRDQALMQLGNIDGALVVYRHLLELESDQQNVQLADDKGD